MRLINNNLRNPRNLVGSLKLSLSLVLSGDGVHEASSASQTIPIIVVDGED